MKKKLHIAMIGQKKCPSREGGVEVVVEELATRMVQLGHSVACYNRAENNNSKQGSLGNALKEYKGIKIKRVFTINKKGLAAMSSSFFAAIAVSFTKCDIIHFHAEGPSFMCFIPKLFGKKVIVTIHGLDWARSKWGNFATWYLKQGEKMAVRFADEIIVLSDNLKNYFEKTYGRKTHFISNGVNQSTFRHVGLIKEKYALEGDDYILFLARLVPEKGVLSLIKAFKDVKTDKKLIIAGKSSDTDGFTKILHDNAKDDPRIIFTGFVEGRVLEELYSNAFIYTLPSDLEGMPITLLEAMSYGNCCLTSSIPECTEVLDDKGFTFEKNNLEDLKSKLQFLCDHPDIVYKYKAYTSEGFYEKYSWDNVVHQTLELYNKV